jgi:hypothetical protein
VLGGKAELAHRLERPPGLDEQYPSRQTQPADDGD